MKANVENAAEVLHFLTEYLTALRDAFREGERRLTLEATRSQSDRLSLDY